MLKHFVPLVVIVVLISFGCSKKSQDNPSPTNNQNPNPTNPSTNTTQYGLYYTFKGTTYKSAECGYSNAFRGNGDHGYGYNMQYICDPKQPDNFFTVENFGLYTFPDSVRFMKLVGKKLKQFNGTYPIPTNYPPYSYQEFDTLNLDITFSNPKVKYRSFNGLVKDTIKPNLKHYYQINSVKFSSHTYNDVKLLLSGEFSIAMVNNDDSLDQTTVKGYFNDLEYSFTRK